ncbi:hypothetical protein [Psychrobacillus sp. NPDC093180]|uniref:hypothetical protein n=1 Tax=Psychrobacillus sp. NPDC093180 TaxID=3364489 RepID=UPI00381F9EB3
MDKECYVKVQSDWLKGEFIGIFQHSEVLNPSPIRGGHNGGTIAFPIAVVRLNEQLKEVKLSDITFKC